MAQFHTEDSDTFETFQELNISGVLALSLSDQYPYFGMGNQLKMQCLCQTIWIIWTPEYIITKPHNDLLPINLAIICF